MTYREDTRDVVIDALKRDGLEIHPEIIADTLINNLLELDTIVCSLPKPMVALLRCLHATGLWGCTIEEVLERLAADQLRAMMTDKADSCEFFPGGLHHVLDWQDAGNDEGEDE